MLALYAYLVSWLRNDEKGQTMAEYGLILALIAVVVIVALTALGTQISTTFSTIAGEIAP